MDACVGAPHLSRNLKPTVTIRDWSPQNMTRVRFARKVQDYALARCGGKGQLWVMYGRVWTAPAVQEESDYQRSVRVRSCIRPLSAAVWPLALM